MGQKGTGSRQEKAQQGREDLGNVFWKFVRIKLKEQGHSFTWLAEEGGFSKQALITASSISSPVRIHTAIRIAKVLGCNISELVYGMRDRQESEAFVSVSERMGYLNPDLQKMIANRFGELTVREQKAILIHAASYLGISPEDILKEVIV